MNSFKNCSSPFHKLVRSGILMPGKLILMSCTLLSAAITFQACGPSFEEMKYREESKIIEDSLARYIPGITTDTLHGISHNFIRTANIKCKVVNVLEASKVIEELVAKRGGYISVSDFSSQVNYTHKTQFKKDSLIESTFYTNSNFIRLRVPVKHFDSLLREIADLPLFINFRNLKADDVKMDLYANALNETRLHAYTSAIKTKLKSSSAKNTPTKTEDALLEKQTLIDNTKLNSYDLSDRVNYSTLMLELYQSERAAAEVMYFPPPINTYTPPISEELKMAFLNGLNLLKACVLFLVNNWGVIFVFFLLFTLFKTIRPHLLKKSIKKG